LFHICFRAILKPTEFHIGRKRWRWTPRQQLSYIRKNLFQIAEIHTSFYVTRSDVDESYSMCGQRPPSNERTPRDMAPKRVRSQIFLRRRILTLWHFVLFDHLVSDFSGVQVTAR
jgi:hypothetical protein